MRPAVACMALLLPCILSAGEGASFPVRGETHTLARIEPPTGNSAASVIFLPGDGGWRGAAVRIANTIASWGYSVYGFDTRKYLETHTQVSTPLSRELLASDVRSLAAQIAATGHRPVLLVGWSQGAGMAIAAVAGAGSRTPVRGVITLGLPQSAVLGWDWKATLAVLARRDPDQPTFGVAPLLPHVSPAKLWMIYGSQDEYTRIEDERALFHAASEPKRYSEIPGANHRFDGHEDELFRSLREGLQWIAAD